MPDHDLTIDDPLADALRAYEAERLAGKTPDSEEFCRRYPDLGSELREVLAAAALLDRARQSDPSRTGDFVSRESDLPTSLGEYRIVRKIGAGGMGVVYEAVQESLNRHVALKVLPTNISGRKNLLERFKREAQSAAKLHHTNIVPVFGIGDADGTHFYAMQYIRGRPLDKVVNDVARIRGTAPADAGTAVGGTTDLSGGLSETGRGYWTNVARVGQQVASALDYAHAHGIIHRDIKPSNLLLDGSGTVWITDFGLAKSDDTGDNLSETGDVLGTLRYMAPERFRGDSLPQSDLFALGLTLYELLTFRPAFDGKNRAELIAAVQRANPPRPRALNPEVPKELETIVLKAIEPDPAQRYRTGQELADDLLRFIEDRPILAKRAGPIERLTKWAKRNPMAVALILVLVGGVIASASAGVIAVRRGEKVIAVERQNAIDTHRTAMQSGYESGGWKTVVAEADALRAMGYELTVAELLNLIRARDELRQPSLVQEEFNRLAAIGDLGVETGRAHLYRGTIVSSITEADAVSQIHGALALALKPAEREYALGMLAPSLEEAHRHFTNALAFDGRYQPARLQLFLIAILRGDTNEMKAIVATTRLLFPELDDANEFALAYYAYINQPEEAHKAIEELATHISPDEVRILELFTHTVPAARDELEVSSGSLDKRGGFGAGQAVNIFGVIAELKERRSKLPNGGGVLWMARKVRFPAWTNRFERLLQEYDGLLKNDRAKTQAKVRAALADPGVMERMEFLERDIPLGFLMITRATLFMYMAKSFERGPENEDRYFQYTEEAANLFKKATNAPGFVRTTLVGSDGFILETALLLKRNRDRVDKKRLAEAMKVLADRIAASPLTKSRREEFFELIKITGDWEMARRIVEQWKRIDPMNRDVPNWDIMVDGNTKNYIRALERINLQLTTWEIEEWALRLNPNGALGQLVLADGNSRERQWLKQNRDFCAAWILREKVQVNPRPKK
ncbi:MAG TPA: serine/threonine-protein kinase [Gemmataceae bacterium]|jgi:serine/threonine protein kinase|nr:serine/threonine-protein kinase [Gemmataceae bacterium]